MLFLCEKFARTKSKRYICTQKAKRGAKVSKKPQTRNDVNTSIWQNKTKL